MTVSAWCRARAPPVAPVDPDAAAAPDAAAVAVERGDDGDIAGEADFLDPASDAALRHGDVGGDRSDAPVAPADIADSCTPSDGPGLPVLDRVRGIDFGRQVVFAARGQDTPAILVARAPASTSGMRGKSVGLFLKKRNCSPDSHNSCNQNS